MRDTQVVEVGPKGRIVIPAPIRRQLAIDEGTELVALVDGDGLLLLPRSAVKRRLREMFGTVGTSLSAELLEDRRAAGLRGE